MSSMTLNYGSDLHRSDHNNLTLLFPSLNISNIYWFSCEVQGENKANDFEVEF